MSETFVPHPSAIAEPWPGYIALLSTLTVLSTVFIFLRVMSRWKLGDFGWDDWTMFLSYFFSLAFLADYILCATVGGAGYPVETYTIAQLNAFSKILYAGNMIYDSAVCLSKASVIFYYRRIFAFNRSFHIYTIILLGLLMGIYIAESFALTFADYPVEAQWNVEIPHTQIRDIPLWLSGALTFIAIDVLIIVTPIFHIWNLKMATDRKLGIAALFLLGSVVTVATILKVIYVATQINLNNATYTGTNVILWAGLEIYLSIICMNMPAAYALWRDARRNRKPKLTSKTRQISDLTTFGSQPSKKLKYENLGMTTQGTVYEAYVVGGDKAETASMAPLTDSVRIERSYEVV
ncbi:hypothetical protein F5Y16DRAFT_393128 [Xylariaceae sp. FL0255]|nr:hypothetical protein F5Y16DRAFT_393128 [Xylariaceae sp. FL0255]